MPEASPRRPSRAFNDLEDDTNIFEVWVKKLKRGLCFPRDLVESARNDVDVIYLLQNVRDWILEKENIRINCGDPKKYDLPAYRWKVNLRRYCADIPKEKWTYARTNFSENEYEEWKYLAAYVLEKGIQDCKEVENGHQEGDDYIAPNEVRLKEHTRNTRSETSKDVGAGHSLKINNRITKFKAIPQDFKETEDFEKLQGKFPEWAALQLYGPRLCGKTYYLKGLVDTYAKATKEETHSTIIWQFDCDQGGLSLQDEFEKIAEKLSEKSNISPESLTSLKEDLPNITVNLIKLIREKEINALFAFENVSGEYVREVKEIIQTIFSLEKSQNTQIKIIATTEKGKNAIFDQVFAAEMTGFLQWPVNAYTDQEALQYLMSESPPEVVCYRYLADDRETGFGNLFTKSDAEELAQYYKNSPGCLRAAKVYCLTRKVTYKQYRDSMREQQSLKLIAAQEAEIMKNVDEDTGRAYQALRRLTSVDEACNEATKRMKTVLDILSYVHHEDIPILYVGKICQLIRPNSAELTAAENFELNLHESSDVVYRLEETCSFENESRINYPNGVLTIPKSALDALRCSNENGDHLAIALEAMVQMLSKDNTKKTANMRLLLLRLHIDQLVPHCNKFLEKHFHELKKEKQNFKLAMLVCRLFELFAQSIIQGRIEADSKVGLKMLTVAANQIWQVISAYHNSRFTSFVCGLGYKSPIAESLEYNEKNDPNERGKYIAKLCSKAGKKVGSEALMSYWQASVTFNETNFSDFLHNIVDEMPGENFEEKRKAAESKLQGVKSLVEKKLSCQQDDIRILRETGNLLSEKQLQQSFFAERLSSIFHTYGRQVLYLQNDMSKEEQKQCEYYTLLAHHIAKATRLKTGVGLLNEYITIANGKVPRLLQNRPQQADETVNERCARLLDAHKQCKSLLDIDWKPFENACFRLVKDTGYTKLNAYKYMVKANTKLLKHNADHLPKTAIEECDIMLRLAKDNSGLDMAPHCIINAGRFYAATKRFKDAFAAFSEGFEYENANKDGVSGIIHLRDWRPNSVAWAVHNYCMAVDAYSKQEVCEDLWKKKTQAWKYCQQVLNLEPLRKEWEEKMMKWSEEFHGSK